MNCLFVNWLEPVANSGGIETVTGTLCKEFLEQYSVKSYCLWQLGAPADAKRYPFAQSVSLKDLSKKGMLTNEISVLLDKWNIDVVIVQAYNEMVPIMRKAIDFSDRKIALVYALHSMPGWEFNISKWNNVKKMPEKQGISGIIKLIGYPFFRIYSKAVIKRRYRRIHVLSDKIVLLSEKFIPEYKNKFSIADDSKIIAIPNPVNFVKEECEACNFDKKSKIVLIVSRLVENIKRLSLALDAWEQIEKDMMFNDWQLIIVGDGPDESMYSDYIKQHNLKRVSMAGRQDPTQYYKRAPIFLMTSEYEGFGMTLVEAQSFGCVPIAYNSFASLTDIIQNGKDGYVVENSNCQEYLDSLKKLMINDNCRKEMSINAMNNVQRFDVNQVGKKWISFFKNIVPV